MSLKLKLSVSVATIAFFVVGVSSSARAQVFWIGGDATSPNNPTVSDNWSGTPPTIGAVNTNGLWTNSAVALDYTSTTTTLGTFAGGYNGLSWLGNGANSTVNITGGTLSFNGSFSNDGGTEGLWVGNGGYYSTNLTINGGNVVVSNGTLLGRDNATGNISVSNGSFTTGAFNSSIGLSMNLKDNSGGGSVIIGNGGLFDVSAAAIQPILFQTLTANLTNTGSNYIDFTSGSTGELELNLSTAAVGSNYFSDMVKNGYVEIGGTVDKTLTDYSINDSNLSGATLSLASASPTSVPEPSTWAMMFGGLLMLGYVGRRRVARN